MFIERLTEEDVKQFLKENFGNLKTMVPDLYNFDNSTINIIKEYAEISIGNEYILFLFSDYLCCVFDKYKHSYSHHTPLWRKFMYKKFGKEYKNEFLKKREAEKKVAIEKIKTRYDEETKKLEDEFLK